MYKNDENSFPWQRPLSDSNQILQQSSTPVGTPAGEKLVRLVAYFFSKAEPKE